MKGPNFTGSILKSNKLFSAALFLIYMLVMALLVMLAFFSESIDRTFQSFMDEYHYPDGYVITAGTPESCSELIAQIDGVEAVWGCLTTEFSTELESGRTLPLCYIGTGSGDFEQFYDVDTGQTLQADGNTVALYYYFARANGISTGDKLKVTTAASVRELTVTNIVSCPETIFVGRDSSAWYDTEDYAFLYLSEDQMEALCGTSGYVNEFRLQLADEANQQAIMEQVLEVPAINAVSSSVYENSLVDKQLHAAIDSTRAIVTYVPAFIILIGILFSTLFMGQIIRKAAKNIALLRSLGYSSGRISGIYVRYSLLVSTASAVFGTLLGFLLLRLLLLIYQNFYALPYIRYAGRWWVILILLVVIQAIGAISCLACSRDIGRVDPAIVFGRSMDNGGQKLPGWLEHLKVDAYSRISLCAAWRSRKRHAVTVLCYVACLILTFLAVAILFTKSEAIRYVFDSRYPYDLLAVFSTDSAEQQLSAMDCVSLSEERIVFSTEYEDEVMRIETLPEGSISELRNTDGRTLALPERGIILEEGFARRHALTVGDTITVGDVELTVKGISRQYLCSVQYISAAQAEAFGFDSANALAIRLKDGVDTTEFSEEACKIDGYSYLVDMGHRRESVSYALSQLNMACYVFIVFAFLMGMVILYNMNYITLTERKREYATLRILGAQPVRFLKMSLLENILQYVLTCVIGIPISIPLSRFLLTAMSSVTEEYVLESTLQVSVITCGVMLLYIVAGMVMTQRYILTMNTLEALGDKE